MLQDDLLHSRMVPGMCRLTSVNRTGVGSDDQYILGKHVQQHWLAGLVLPSASLPASPVHDLLLQVQVLGAVRVRIETGFA